MIATTRILHAAETGHALRPWVWPLPSLDRSSPRILVESARSSPTSRDEVVIGYEPHVALPRSIPVYAVRDGAITYARKTSSGFAVCLDHAGGWTTQYSGLEHTFVATTDRFRKRRKARVRGGDVIGCVGLAAPRVHFELSRCGDDEGNPPVSPIQRMHRWVVLPWTETLRTPSLQLKIQAA